MKPDAITTAARGALLVAMAAAAVAASPATMPSPPSDRSTLFAALERLDADLLTTRSATATLEAWCGEHRLADPPRIVALNDAHEAKPLSPDQRQRLAVRGPGEVRYRHVRLQCGTRVLSEADNWYVPARLTADMNRRLETTDAPFGRVVAPLEPYRRTIAVRLLWTDSTQSIPETLFEHRAVLYTKDHEPFSEVVERYRRDLLEGR